MKKLIMIGWIALCLVFAGSAYAAKGGNSTTEQGALPNGTPFQQIQEQFASIDDQIEDLVGRVESLEERVAAGEAAITDLETANALIQQQITVLEGNVAANADEIDSLHELYNNNLNVIEGLQTQINEINENLALKQDIVNGTCPSGSALQSINPDGSVTCVSTSNGISSFSVTAYQWVTPMTSHRHYRTCSYSHTHRDSWGRTYSETHYYNCNPYYETHPGPEATVKATCPNDSVLAGGGYYGGGHGISITASHSTTTADTKGQSWIVSAVSTQTHGHYVMATANCISFD